MVAAGATRHRRVGAASRSCAARARRRVEGLLSARARRARVHPRQARRPRARARRRSRAFIARRRRAARSPTTRSSAWLMAAFLRGLDDDETAALTPRAARARATCSTGRALGRPERRQALDRRRRRQDLADRSRRWSPRAACWCRWCRAAGSATPAARSTSSSRSPASAPRLEPDAMRAQLDRDRRASWSGRGPTSRPPTASSTRCAT